MSMDSIGSYLQRVSSPSPGLTRRGRKRTKIVATLGPATDSEEVLTALCHAGMNVARLNMSHGNLEQQQARLELVRKVSATIERPIAILADLQGPKIRLGDFAGGVKPFWSPGDNVVVTTSPVEHGTAERIGASYELLHLDVKPGDDMLVDDGKLRLRVERVEGRDIHCRVAVGGVVSSRKGINLPGVQVSAPALTEKDRVHLEWALRAGVDYIALSFVRGAEDIRAVRRHMTRLGRRVPVIAKIERPEAVGAIEEIVAESEGIMVARGDLGIEIRTERLPVIQKHLIARANAHGKIVITATQMLESMISSPVPTRAESSDVANAIFDGSDAVMLSAETSVGQYPVQAVGEMVRIAIEAENCPYMIASQLDEKLVVGDRLAVAVTQAASVLAEKIDASGILVFGAGTERPNLLSERRARRPIVAVCSDDETWRRLSLNWGIVPLKVPPSDDEPTMFKRGLDEAIRQGLFLSDDLLVVIQGTDAEIAPRICLLRV